MWRLLLVGPLVVVLILFALSNTDDVSVRFWPFDLAWQTPLAVAVLAVSALSFLLGASVAWASSLPHRRRSRELTNASRLLEAELDGFRGQAARPVPSAQAGARRDAAALPAP